MKFFVKVKDDKLISKNFAEIWRNFDDGEYEISIRKINDNKTSREFQKEYFAKVDNTVTYSGYNKTEIHSMYKDYRQENGLVDSTKDLHEESEWNEWLEGFQLFIFSKLDIMV
jgi:hypothetical protein